MSGARQDTSSDPSESAADAVEFIGQLGLAMLAAGYAVSDVQTVLARFAASTRLNGAAIATLPSGIFVGTSGSPARLFSQPNGASLRFDQACEIGNLASNAAHVNQSVSVMSRAIAEVIRSPSRYPTICAILGSALMSAGIAVVFGTSVAATITAGIFGLIVGAALIWSGKYPRISSVMPLICGFGVGVVVFSIGSHVGLGHSPLYAVAAPLVMLIPGATITNGVIELAAGDMVSGGARIASGLLVWASLAMGVVGAAAVTRVKIGDLAHLQAAAFPAWAAWIAILAMALGVGLFFSADLRLMIVMAVVLEAAYGIINVVEIPWSSVVASGVAAAIMLPLCRILERLQPELPAIVTFRPAFWLFVPGSMGLVTLTDIATSAPNASTLAGSLVGTVIAIAAGVQVGAFVAQLVPFDGRRETV